LLAACSSPSAPGEQLEGVTLTVLEPSVAAGDGVTVRLRNERDDGVWFGHCSFGFEARQGQSWSGKYAPAASEQGCLAIAWELAAHTSVDWPLRTDTTMVPGTYRVAYDGSVVEATVVLSSSPFEVTGQ